MENRQLQLNEKSSHGAPCNRRIYVVEEEGNLLDMFDKGKFDFIVHGCNSKGLMGEGLAAQVSTRYPSCFEYYRRCCNGVRSELSLLGHNIIYPVQFSDSKTTTTRYIVNMITQMSGGVCPKSILYPSIMEGFRRLGPLLKTGDCVGVPLIGMGIEEGHFDIIQLHIIKALLETLKKNVQIHLHIVNYNNNKYDKEEKPNK